VKRIIPVACILALAAGCDSGDTRFDTTVEVAVTVEEIVPTTIEEFVIATGTVVAVKDAVISGETAGYYRPVNNPATGRPYELGDSVSAAAEVIHLDNPDEENAIRMDSVVLTLDITERMFEQQKILHDKGGVTLSELKDAERSYIDARYAHESAGMRLSKLSVTAPFDGVIVELPQNTPGVRVNAGTEMFRIIDYRKLTMEVSLPEKRIGEVTVGQPVRVSNYTMSDTVLSGRIAQVSPALDPDSRTFAAVITVDNPDLALRPGMFVKTEIIVAASEEAVVVPVDVVIERRNRKTVYVVERGFARYRVVETGLENPDSVEITAGLEAGERLVVDGFETLRDGAAVRIVQERSTGQTSAPRREQPGGQRQGGGRAGR
jgi:membrane fusion protein, multidrug efflux system